MTPQELRTRTRQFAVRIVYLFRALPRTDDAKVIGRQLLRSSTSVAANYRAVGRARSKKEFIAKIGVVLEEADESVFWLELLSEARIMHPERLHELVQEANELTAIFAAARRTARASPKIPVSRDFPNS